MRCEKAKTLMVDYVYEELSEKQRKKLEKHVSQCWGCAFELESFQKTIDLVKSQAEIEESEEFWKANWSRIEERLPQLNVAVKNRSLFGHARDWLSDRMPPSDWIFHELMLKKALPVLGMGIFIVGVSLFVIHTLQTKLGQQDMLSSVERMTKEEALLELPKHNGGNTIQVEFYLIEHERSSLQLASIRNASLSSQPQQKFSLRKDDLFYYEMVGGARSEAGLIMRGRSDWHKSSNHKADDKTQRVDLQSEDVSNGDTISLEEAQRLVSFGIIAPPLIDTDYTLTGVRKIKDNVLFFRKAVLAKKYKRECVQVLYSNGRDVFSLFQQPVGAREGLDRWDFREYIVGLGKNGERTAVLGWYTGEFVFNLVGEVDTARMMGIADEIRNYYLMDGVKEYYREYTEQGR